LGDEEKEVSVEAIRQEEITSNSFGYSLDGGKRFGSKDAGGTHPTQKNP
jgi:hypothetical protein